MSDDFICHVVVRRQFQGVGYRAFIEDEAMQLDCAAGCATAAMDRLKPSLRFLGRLSSR